MLHGRLFHMSRNSPVLRDSPHSRPPLTCDGSPIRRAEMLLNDQRCSLKSAQEVINSKSHEYIYFCFQAKTVSDVPGVFVILYIFFKGIENEIVIISFDFFFFFLSTQGNLMGSSLLNTQNMVQRFESGTLCFFVDYFNASKSMKNRNPWPMISNNVFLVLTCQGPRTSTYK